MNNIIKIFFFLLVLLLSGCATISSWRDNAALKAGYVAKDKIQMQIEQIKKEYNDKLIVKDEEIKNKQKSYLETVNNKEQFASNSLYGADFTFQTLLKPDRAHIIMDNKVNEARSVLPSPTVEAMAQQNIEVKKQLDETQTSLEELKKEHQETLKQADIVNQLAEKAKFDLKQAELDKQNLLKQKDDILKAKQEEELRVTNSNLALEKERSDNKEAIQKAKEKASLYLGLLALGALAGAIWSPVFKAQLGSFAIVLTFVIVTIWYIQAWMVYTAFAIVIIGLIIWAIIEHNSSNKASIATFSALEDIKNNSKDIWDSTIAPALKEWQSKYVTKDGKVTTVPDPSISQYIDKKLAETNQK